MIFATPNKKSDKNITITPSDSSYHCVLRKVRVQNFHLVLVPETATTCKITSAPSSFVHAAAKSHNIQEVPISWIMKLAIMCVCF